jgi:hypothetical protein
MKGLRNNQLRVQQSCTRYAMCNVCVRLDGRGLISWGQVEYRILDIIN